MYSEHMVIPEVLKKRILKDFHTSHLDIYGKDKNFIDKLCFLAKF